MAVIRRKPFKMCGICKIICGREMHCTECDKYFHRDCLKLDMNLSKKAQTYDWLCNDCKHCEKCRSKGSEGNLILCDSCDRGFHCHCLKPPLSSIPTENWICPICKGVDIKKEDCAEESKNWDFRKKSSSMEPVLKRRSTPPIIPSTSNTDETMENGKKRRRKNYSNFFNVSTNMPAKSTSGSPNCKLKNGPNDCCPVDGCYGQGHLSKTYSRHSFIEACPIYHNISDITDEMFAGKQTAVKSEEDNYRLRTPVKDRRQLLDTYETDRDVFDIALRKKLSKNANNDLTDILLFADKSKEIDLQKFAVTHDLELFRKAQIALAEELEVHPESRCRKANQVKYVEFDGFEIEAFYASPYPDDVSHYEKLYVCQTCLKYLKSRTQLESHLDKCTLTHPPGKEIYRKDELCVYEVDGSMSKVFCQNLCLLAKLFLDHKTLYYDVEPFLFYVLTENTDDACHIVGYFSKEKESIMNCNLSCLLVLPSHQRSGYGRFLIELSYLLSKSEDKIGSPEHPLSDMGLVAYRGYWKEKILDDLSSREEMKGFSVKDLSQRTGIHVNDLIGTLQYYGLVKYWRGEYWIFRDQEMIDKHKKAVRKKSTNKRVDPSSFISQNVKEETLK